MVKPRTTLCAAIAVAATCAATTAAHAADASGPSIDLGARGSVMVGDGEPTNDVNGFGLIGHWWLGERWGLGAALDHSAEFDVERTPRMLGIDQDRTLEDIDNKATATGFRLWAERRYGRPAGRVEWFWGIGAGIDSIDSDDAIGRTAAGAPLRIRIDAGAQPLVTALGGLRWRWGAAWHAEIALRAEQHLADWTVEDTVSGRRATVGGYLLTGISFGLARRF